MDESYSKKPYKNNKYIYFMQNTLVFIDKGFLDVLSKHFGGGKPIKYDFFKLAKKISNEQGFVCEKIYLYLAPPYQSENPSFEERERKKKYDKFLSKLSKNNLMCIREGRVQKITENGEIFYKQKGVDNLITKDLCYFQRDFPKISTVILVSSDSDFAPIIEELREEGMNIILYNYFEKRRNSKFSVSNYLIKSVSKWEKLTKKHLEDAQIEK